MLQFSAASMGAKGLSTDVVEAIPYICNCSHLCLQF